MCMYVRTRGCVYAHLQVISSVRKTFGSKQHTSWPTRQVYPALLAAPPPSPAIHPLYFKQLGCAQRKVVETLCALHPAHPECHSCQPPRPLLQMADCQDLQTVRRQQVCERSWHSLAQHFAILLSDRDTEQLLAVQEHILAWKAALTEFTESQQSLEAQLHTEVVHAAN